MSPLAFFSLMVGLTVLARTIHEIVRCIRRRRLRQLASQWRMGYAHKDLFNLRGRIAGCFPVPDAIDLRVVDLIYGSQDQQHRYVFTAEYTCPIDGGWRRERRVMTFCEPCDSLPTVASPVMTSPAMTSAPDDLSILEQYRHLYAHALNRLSSVLSGAAT